MDYCIWYGIGKGAIKDDEEMLERMTFHSERKLFPRGSWRFFFQKPHICMYIYIHWKVSHIHIIHIYIYDIILYIYIHICYTSRVIWLPVWHLIPGSAGFQKHLSSLLLAGGTTLSFADVLGDFVVLQQEPAKALGAVYIYICYILYLRDNWVYP